MRLEEILRLEDLLQNMGDAFVSLDNKWRYIFANDNALRLMGKHKDELIGKVIWDVFPDTIGTIFEQEFALAMYNKQPVSFETYYPGYNMWLEVRAKPCEDGICIFYTDISTGKRAEQSLKQSEELFAKAFYSCPAALVISEIESGRIIDTNESYELLIRFKKNELIGRDIRLLHDSAARRQMIKEVQKKGKVRNFKMDIKDKLGRTINCVLSADLINLNDKECVITSLVDVTELNQVHEELSKLNANLEQLVRERTAELADALQREKGMNEMKSQFVTMASHEFRTPLSTILSSASLIEKYTLPEHQAQRNKHVERIKYSVKNLTDILNEFLSLEKLEQGKVEPENEEFDLKDFTTGIVEDLSGILKDGQHIVHNHLGEMIVTLDKKMLRNVLLNLLSNAIKYSKKEIIILTEVKGTQIKISVTDKGIGIPDDEQKHLFGMFFRARNATNIQGTGLGLNIVKRYLELLNGSIEFVSEQGVGTTFIVRFPNKLNIENTYKEHMENA